MLGHDQHHARNYQGQHLGYYHQFKFLEFFNKRNIGCKYYPVVINSFISLKFKKIGFTTLSIIFIIPCILNSAVAPIRTVEELPPP